MLFDILNPVNTSWIYKLSLQTFSKNCIEASYYGGAIASNSYKNLFLSLKAERYMMLPSTIYKFIELVLISIFWSIYGSDYGVSLQFSGIVGSTA